MIPLILGTLLAIGALVYVLYPVFGGQRRASVAVSTKPAEETELDPAEVHIEALREIEFDRATGKLSEGDYSTLRAQYTADAVAAMRAAGASESLTGDEIGDDAVEALVARFRGKKSACPSCGPRPEPDAAFCSNCGRFLGNACGNCGAPPSEPDARFCARCGAALGAVLREKSRAL